MNRKSFWTICCVVFLLLSGMSMFLGSRMLTHAANPTISLQLPWPTGQKHNINGGYTYHCPDHIGLDNYAIDFALSSGSQVSAVAAGTAHLAHYRGGVGYGNYVWISHANNFVSLYGHLSSFAVTDG